MVALKNILLINNIRLGRHFSTANKYAKFVAGDAPEKKRAKH